MKKSLLVLTLIGIIITFGFVNSSLAVNPPGECSITLTINSVTSFGGDPQESRAWYLIARNGVEGTREFLGESDEGNWIIQESSYDYPSIPLYYEEFKSWCALLGVGASEDQTTTINPNNPSTLTHTYEW